MRGGELAAHACMSLRHNRIAEAGDEDAFSEQQLARVDRLCRLTQDHGDDRCLAREWLKAQRQQLFAEVTGILMQLVNQLHQNARYFREQLLSLGFKPLAGETPIVPVILGETAKAIHTSELLLAEGVFVTGFGYPVVPQGHARVRCQLSAAHTKDDLDFALRAFKKVGSKLGLI